MTDPIDQLLAEFTEVTATARVARPVLPNRRRPALATALAAALVVVVAATFAFVVIGTRPTPAPVAATSPSPSAANSTGAPTVAPNASESSPPSTSSVACTSILGNMPMVKAVSGSPRLVAAYEVTGAAFAIYLPSLVHTDGGIGEFSWQDTGPNDVVAVCFIDGDLITETPGPPGHDISAVRVLVAVSNGQAQLVAFARHDPSVLPITDPTTVATSTPATPIPTSPLPTATPTSIGSVRTWAPDSQHLIATGNSGEVIVDSRGTITGTLPVNFVQADWFDSSTVITYGDPPDGGNEVRLYNLTGAQVDAIPGQFGGIVTAPGMRTVAVIELPPQGEPQRYKIWDGSSLSEWREGVPMAWSADGSRLAVFHLTRIAGLYGTLSIVDRQGAAVRSIDGWTTTMTDTVEISPDGRYLATCLANASAASIKVVDIETGAIDDIAPGCGYVLAWSNEPKLYVSYTVAPPVTWTPDAGVGDSGLAADALVSVAANGEVAAWSSGSPTVQVFIGDSVEGYTLPGTVSSATLSPGGRAMAVSWSPPPDSGGSAFTMITPSQSPTSPQPPIAMETAKGIAQSFFTSPDTHGSASVVTDVVIGSATLGTEIATGRLAWTVEIKGKVTGPDPTEPSDVSMMILLIDAETGDVQIFAQKDEALPR